MTKPRWMVVTHRGEDRYVTCKYEDEDHTLVSIELRTLAPDVRLSLVAAVRDAARLPAITAERDALLLQLRRSGKARFLAEHFDETSASRDWVLGTYGAAQTFFTLGDLLDALAVSSPGTETPEVGESCAFFHHDMCDNPKTCGCPCHEGEAR